MLDHGPMPSGKVTTANGVSIATPTLACRAIAFALRRWGAPPVRVVLWDGSQVLSGEQPPKASVLIRSRTALLRLLSRPSLQFGECYRDGSIEIEGDLVGLLEAVNRLDEPRASPLATVQSALRTLVPANSHAHYELGSPFYRLWLDSRMVYTCAYFKNLHTGLEEAQSAKLDLVCRKLRLRAGETVVEAGCGWGALALHMARHYGVTVRAFNVSADQIAYAREEAVRQSLGGRVEFIEGDYRSIEGRFDAFVSVGLLEHVGKRNYPAFGRLMRRCLDENGRGLLQTIGRNRPFPTNPWIHKRIFPGGYTPSLKEMAAIFETNSLSVLHMENLRPHYSRTLELWRQRFESASPAISELFDEPFVRTWRLYLAAAEAAFRAGWLQLFQVLFAPATNRRLPLKNGTATHP